MSIIKKIAGNIEQRCNQVRESINAMQESLNHDSENASAYIQNKTTNIFTDAKSDKDSNFYDVNLIKQNLINLGFKNEPGDTLSHLLNIIDVDSDGLVEDFEYGSIYKVLQQFGKTVKEGELTLGQLRSIAGNEEMLNLYLSLINDKNPTSEQNSETFLRLNGVDKNNIVINAHTAANTFTKSEFEEFIGKQYGSGYATDATIDFAKYMLGLDQNAVLTDINGNAINSKDDLKSYYNEIPKTSDGQNPVPVGSIVITDNPSGGNFHSGVILGYTSDGKALVMEANSDLAQGGVAITAYGFNSSTEKSIRGYIQLEESSVEEQTDDDNSKEIVTSDEDIELIQDALIDSEDLNTRDENNQLDLDTYYQKYHSNYNSSDREEYYKLVSEEITKTLADQFGINVADNNDYTAAMMSVYKQLLENNSELLLNSGYTLDENSTIADISNVLARFSWDGKSGNDLIDLSKVSQERISQDILMHQEDSTNSEDENVLVEYEQAYDASIGTLSTLDMNNYWYTNGRMTHQEALARLKSDIMTLYGISDNDSDKEKRLELAFEDIIRQNSSIEKTENQSYLDAILRIGNDGKNNDLINVTRHSSDKDDTQVTLTRRTDKTTGELLSEETENEYREFSIDENGTRIAKVYSKENGKKGDEPFKTVYYDDAGNISYEDESDYIVKYQYGADGNVVSASKYPKDENGKIADIPSKTIIYNGYAVISKALGYSVIAGYTVAKESIDENTVRETIYNVSRDNFPSFDEIEKSEIVEVKETRTVPIEGGRIETTNKYDAHGNLTYSYVDELFNGVTLEGDKYQCSVYTNNLNNTKERYIVYESGKIEQYRDYNNDGIDDEVRVIDPSKGSKEDIMLNIDKTIDFNAQGAPDCWYLATLKSFASTEKGQKLLDELFTDNNDGTYTMHFKGVGKDIVVSNDELSAARKNGYSRGDNTVLLYEVALNKLLHDMENNPNDYDFNTLRKYASTITTAVQKNKSKSDSKNILNGAQLGYFTYLFFKEPAKGTNSFDAFKEENFDFNNTAAFITFGNKKEKMDSYSMYVKYDKNSRKCELITNHAWAVTKVDKENNTITIVNPWDNSIEYVFDMDEFESYFKDICIQYYNM